MDSAPLLPAMYGLRDGTDVSFDAKNTPKSRGFIQRVNGARGCPDIHLCLVTF
jgi:hypothetical protein